MRAVEIDQRSRRLQRSDGLGGARVDQTIPGSAKNEERLPNALKL
jgi:hypothetical protein